jgi:uncharacterized heparinase superfamily protein
VQGKLHRIKLLYYSLRYTRAKQLLARFRLLIKRKAISLIAWRSLKESIALTDPSAVHVVSKPPQPLFPKRNHFVVSTAPLTLKFLNEERVLAMPIEWRPDDLKTGTRLWLLNMHYMEFLEALDSEESINIIGQWIDSNLPYDKGYWLDNWNCYSLSIRVVVWMQFLARIGITVENKLLSTIHSSLKAQIRFLVNNLELDIGGNHLIKNIKALLWASKYFSGEEAMKWQTLGAHLLKQEICEQILSDGMHYELSPAYHCQVFADLLECYRVLDNGELKQLLQVKLDGMAQVVCDLTHPDDQISLFNDSGLNMAYQPAECLEVYERLFNKSVIRNRVIQYDAAGYYGLHNDNDSVIVDCGNLAPDFLPAHGHGDALAFEWSVAGLRIVIDPGVYEYNTGEWRQYSRSTISHNTLTLDNLDQSEFWKAFRVGRRAKVVRREVKASEDGLKIDASHDGYKRMHGMPVHRRTFDMKPGYIHIEDFVQGGDGQEAISRIMLHPDCTVEQKGKHTVIVNRGDVRIKVDSNKTISVSPAWCFLNFGEKHQTNQLCIHIGNAPCSGSTTLTSMNIMH